ncbi:uncharacterized protein LOC114743146 [Neltuma alba]|uniref:uncharacterized protein LOC114743146 n=1 Tax=Neltuma alba TaxID=207710 RepID=UPI0010A4845C|nr:uncharacterized protein LOC114743146 [Prosopis alba]
MVVIEVSSFSLQQETHIDGDTKLLDDSEIYQQLLKEFFKTVNPTSSEKVLYALKKMQPKKRKLVDHQASKTRKIRYNVHENVVNVMALESTTLPPMVPKLFGDLFGLKSQRLSTGLT